jgi:multidrug efflux system membrane fusion protein
MSKEGLLAQVDVHGSGNGHAVAPVDFVSNAVSDQTGTIELRATFPNTDYRLVPGQLVDVTLTLDSIPNATVVARDAVNAGPEGDYVYRIGPDTRVSMVPVKLLFDDGSFDAITGEVKPGDTLVTEGQLRLVPGATVSISNAPSPQRQILAPGAQ